MIILSCHVSPMTTVLCLRFEDRWTNVFSSEIIIFCENSLCLLTIMCIFWGKFVAKGTKRGGICEFSKDLFFRRWARAEDFLFAFVITSWGKSLVFRSTMRQSNSCWLNLLSDQMRRILRNNLVTWKFFYGLYCTECFTFCGPFLRVCWIFPDDKKLVNSQYPLNSSLTHFKF